MVRIRCSHCSGQGSVQGTEILQVAWCGQNKKNKITVRKIIKSCQKKNSFVMRRSDDTASKC